MAGFQLKKKKKKFTSCRNFISVKVMLFICSVPSNFHLLDGWAKRKAINRYASSE